MTTLNLKINSNSHNHHHDNISNNPGGYRKATTSRTSASASARTSTSTVSRPSFQFMPQDLEHMMYQAEHGVVGVEQEDETHYDTRHKNSAAIQSDDEDDAFAGLAEEEGEEDEVDPHHLPFSKKKLYGRSKELQLLNDCMHRSLLAPQTPAATSTTATEPSIHSSSSPNCIFLSGYSGSGKTRLIREAVRKFTKQVLQQEQHKHSSAPQAQDGEESYLPPTSVQPMFISGKYEELRTPNPYKGIAEAFGNWYANLSVENQSVFSFIQQELEGIAGEEDANLLLEMIPRMATVSGTRSTLGSETVSVGSGRQALSESNRNKTAWGDNNSISTSNTSRIQGKYESQSLHRSINKSRFHFVFRVFLECLCIRESPLILFLDDLQWADHDSLKLLEYILTSSSTSIPYFLLIGSFRSNEVQAVPDHPVMKLIEAVQVHCRKEDNDSDATKATSPKGNVHVLELQDLSSSDITEFISDTLSRSKEEILPLSNVVYNKTLGNMFFTIQALEQLVRKNAIYYDTICFQWTFHRDTTTSTNHSASINNTKTKDATLEEYLESLLSDEVVEMVQSKIQSMPIAMQYLLIVASYIRSTFPASILHEVLETIQHLDSQKHTIKKESHGSSDFCAPPKPQSSLSVDSRFSQNKEIVEDGSWCVWTFQNVMKYLDQAVLEGLLVHVGGDDDDSNAEPTKKTAQYNKEDIFTGQEYYYAFAHDRIREGASRFVVPGKNKDFLLVQIANVLAERGLVPQASAGMSSSMRSGRSGVGEAADWMLFTAVRHYNSIPTLSGDQAIAKSKAATSSLGTSKRGSSQPTAYTLSILNDQEDNDYNFNDFFLSLDYPETSYEDDNDIHEQKPDRKMLDFRIRLATLHLATCQLSISKAAFTNVSEYSEKGLQWLFLGSPNSSFVSDLQSLDYENDDEVKFLWMYRKNLCQELYTFAAEASRIMGDIPKMEFYCNAFLSAKKKESLDAKFNIYYIMAQGFFFGSDRFDEAIQILLDLLKHLNCRFPTGAVGTTWQIIYGLSRLNASKKKRTREELENLEPMTDPSKLETMRMLDKLFEMCYLSANAALLPLVIFRGIDYTFKYGYSIYSPRVIAAAGMLFTAALNDYSDGGALYPNYAMDMLKLKLDNYRPSLLVTTLLSYGFGLHHTTLYHKCISPMHRVYEIGMATGEFEYALWGTYNLMMFSLLCGATPLSIIERDHAKYIPIMEEMGKRIHAICSRCTWGLILGLLGRSKEPSKIDWSEAERENSILIVALNVCKRFELGYSGEYETCAELSIQDGGQSLKAGPGVPTPMVDICLCALSCAIMLQKTGKHKYKKDLKRTRGWIKAWTKQGNPNLHHWKALIDAELAVHRKKHKLASEKFELAVTLASEGGFVHDAAIANERWGVFALSTLADTQRAESCVKQALRLYQQRGAEVCVQKVKKKYARLLSNSFFNSKRSIEK